MNNPNYVLGVDIGTTSTKVVLFTDKGEVVRQDSGNYPLYCPTPGAAEQDPEEIFSEVITTINQVLTDCPLSNLLCISFATAMHTLIAVDEEGELLTNSITWADNRGAPWAEKIKAEHNGKEIYQRTGTPIHGMSPFVKLVWLRHEKPEIFQQAAKFISIKEYIFQRFFSEYVVDYALAATTGLFNSKTLTWDQEALAVAGITEEKLSRVVPPTEIFQPIHSGFAEAMGIAPEIPVVIGASDGVLSNLGVGAISRGMVAVTVGTSGALRMMVDKPKMDAQQRLFCYPLLTDKWVVGGAVNNGGIALSWVREQLAANEATTAKLLQKGAYELLNNIAETTPAGAEGLIFHPYLAGERSPLWDGNARASFFGLSLRHTKAHLIRAVLEGVVYNLYLVFQALEDVVGKGDTILASGGFAKSSIWRQILADVFNREITVPTMHESTSFGAAILGLYALGRISSLDVVTDLVSHSDIYQPIPENVSVYERIMPLYSSLLTKFQAEYAAIARIQEETASQ
ncbi:gluconokinase [Oscillatoria salina]|uniref:gluconokinase n=1 Tax=Oscillatoria salina TaxID=331517 RepID=UPI001CCEC6E8|nr:gluconokinase [Oscillatoria salina]MBZ8180772.1 gluconokinase [Oscillatoria salina IIICB1]